MICRQVNPSVDGNPAYLLPRKRHGCSAPISHTNAQVFGVSKDFSVQSRHTLRVSGIRGAAADPRQMAHCLRWQIVCQTQNQTVLATCKSALEQTWPRLTGTVLAHNPITAAPHSFRSFDVEQDASTYDKYFQITSGLGLHQYCHPRQALAVCIQFPLSGTHGSTSAVGHRLPPWSRCYSWSGPNTEQQGSGWWSTSRRGWRTSRIAEALMVVEE